MRILLLADASSPHTERWARGLEALGHEVNVASFQMGWEPGREIIGLRGRGRLRYWMAGRQVRSLAEEHDAVLAHFLPAYGVSAWSAGVPFALVLWGSDILAWPFRDRLRFGLARLVLASARWVVADSLTVRRVIQLNFGYPPDRVSVFPFGPEEDALSFPNAEKDESLVVFPRAAERIYSPETALRALALLSAEGLAVRIVFTMGGSLAEECRALAARLGVQAEFKGPLPRPRYLETLARAWVYLSTALSDATPVSLLEAMAQGVFPVASDIPAIREWILDGFNGILVDPRSPRSVASALRRALRDRDLHESAMALNRKVIAERGPWTENLKGLSEILLRIGEIKPPKLARGKKGAFWSYASE